MYRYNYFGASKMYGLIFSLSLSLISFNLFATENKYLLLPDDILQISVWKEVDLQREVLIRPDGKISFPLTGHIMAAGRTPEEVEKVIVNKLSRYIPDPVVTVAVSKLAGYKIYVLGKVAKPGQYIAPHINVMQALSLAGGLTRFASESNIRILRQTNGKHQALQFNYDDVAEGKKSNQNIVLQSGDVLVVR